MSKTLVERTNEQFQKEQDSYIVALDMLIKIAQDECEAAADRIEACKFLIEIHR